MKTDEEKMSDMRFEISRLKMKCDGFDEQMAEKDRQIQALKDELLKLYRAQQP